MRESKENVSCMLYRHSLPFAYFRLQKAKNSDSVSETKTDENGSVYRI